MRQEHIDTIRGRALYIRTEEEDAHGRWNDNYYTRDGYYVIHEGRLHHVYQVPANELL